MQGHWRLSPSKPLKLHLLTLAGLIRSLSNSTIRRGVSEEKLTEKTTYYFLLLPHRGFICFVPPHTPRARHMVDTRYNFVEWMNVWMNSNNNNLFNFYDTLYSCKVPLCLISLDTQGTQQDYRTNIVISNDNEMTDEEAKMQRVKVFCPVSQS